MLCPRCDQQGDVPRVRIIATGEVAHLCDECDAFWPTGIEVGSEGYFDFSSYVKPLGLRGVWNEVTVLDEPSL
jgi:hypothetical protein